MRSNGVEGGVGYLGRQDGKRMEVSLKPLCGLNPMSWLLKNFRRSEQQNLPKRACVSWKESWVPTRARRIEPEWSAFGVVKHKQGPQKLGSSTIGCVAEYTSSQTPAKKGLGQGCERCASPTESFTYPSMQLRHSDSSRHFLLPYLTWKVNRAGGSSLQT